MQCEMKEIPRHSDIQITMFTDSVSHARHDSVEQLCRRSNTQSNCSQTALNLKAVDFISDPKKGL